MMQSALSQFTARRAKPPKARPLRGEKLIRQMEAPSKALKPRPLLSRRETELMGLVSEWIPVKEAAARMGITCGTALGYLDSIYRKLDVHTRYEAIRKFREMKGSGAKANG